MPMTQRFLLHTEYIDTFRVTPEARLTALKANDSACESVNSLSLHGRKHTRTDFHPLSQNPAVIVDESKPCLRRTQ